MDEIHPPAPSIDGPAGPQEPVLDDLLRYNPTSLPERRSLMFAGPKPSLMIILFICATIPAGPDCDANG